MSSWQSPISLTYLDFKSCRRVPRCASINACGPESRMTSLLARGALHSFSSQNRRVRGSMPSPLKSQQEIKLDERLHVEKPFLDQLAGLGWQVIDCDSKQHPSQTFRESFTEVVMLPVLREQLKVINPWLEDDQIEEVIKQLTASFPGTNLIQNNRHVLQLLLENTSVSENRKTGEKSPTVRFIDFQHRD